MDLTYFRQIIVSILEYMGLSHTFSIDYPETLLNPAQTTVICAAERIESQPDENAGYAGTGRRAFEMTCRMRLTFYFPRGSDLAAAEQMVTRFGDTLRFDRRVRVSKMERGSMRYDKVCRMRKIPLTVTMTGQIVQAEGDSL